MMNSNSNILYPYFKLYVVHDSLKSIKAIKNIQSILNENLKNNYTLDIIDVFESPGDADNDRITATPTLIRIFPEPARRLIGDLSKKDEVCFLLGFFD